MQAKFHCRQAMCRAEGTHIMVMRGTAGPGTWVRASNLWSTAVQGGGSTAGTAEMVAVDLGLRSCWGVHWFHGDSRIQLLHLLDFVVFFFFFFPVRRIHCLLFAECYLALCHAVFHLRPLIKAINVLWKRGNSKLWFCVGAEPLALDKSLSALWSKMLAFSIQMWCGTASWPHGT